MQEYLWENGYEMKVEVRGTTLHVYYILAGNALAFQFGKFFVAKSESNLREAGFKKVVLESDDHYWVWNLG
jgi:hypothetical protein